MFSCTHSVTAFVVLEQGGEREKVKPTYPPETQALQVALWYIHRAQIYNMATLSEAQVYIVHLHGAFRKDVTELNPGQWADWSCKPSDLPSYVAPFPASTRMARYETGLAF